LLPPDVLAAARDAGLTLAALDTGRVLLFRDDGRQVGSCDRRGQRLFLILPGRGAVARSSAGWADTLRAAARAA
jgi:hypothetical protein